MKRRSSRRRHAAEQGVAAVEMALVLPLLLVLLALPLFFGRVFWHYSVAQRAAHDAAHYLATVPQTDMLSPASGGEPAAIDVAREIIAQETAWLSPGHASPAVMVQCDGVGNGCLGHKLPKRVGVVITMYMYDDFFPTTTSIFTGSFGVEVNANVSLAYVGN